jgi:hypothetical protein
MNDIVVQILRTNPVFSWLREAITKSSNIISLFRKLASFSGWVGIYFPSLTVLQEAFNKNY